MSLHPCEKARPLLLPVSRTDDHQHISRWLCCITRHPLDPVVMWRLADSFRDAFYRVEGRYPIRPNFYSSAEVNLALRMLGDWSDSSVDFLLEFIKQELNS